MHMITAIFKPLALAALTITVAQGAIAAAELKPTDVQKRTAKALVEQLENRHYSRERYDDDLSKAHLSAYFDALDPNRVFFLASDISRYQSSAKKLDDQWRKGDLDTGFDIFLLYQKRMTARLNKTIDTMEKQLANFDYTIDEHLPIYDDNADIPWATTQDTLDERWRKRIKNQALSLLLAEKKPEDVAKTLKKRYRNQLKRLDQFDEKEVFGVYANALTQLYDPHTTYLSPRRAENFNINMRLSLEGIGAVLQLDEDYTKVARIVAKGPADKQGELKPADKIVAVGQGKDGEMEDVIGWRLDEVVDLIRGPKDSTVRLEVIPDKAPDSRKTITIVRNKVKLEEQSAQKEIIEVQRGEDTLRFGVLDIPTFYVDFDAMRRGEKDYKSTTRDVKRLIGELEKEGVDGIIVDLRNNGGGSLQEANALTGLFIEYGPTVQIRHSSRQVWRDGKRMRTPYYDGPLLVMINRLSASASEIFAGAIQDYERGIVVGDQSFGKGTVQVMLSLPEGHIKLTESKFYRISGGSTQHKGVIPDIVFPSLYDPESVGESALDKALAWDEIDAVSHRPYRDIDSLLPELTRRFKERATNDPDYVYLQDQLRLVEKTRQMTSLPLKRSARQAQRDENKQANLDIENKRRKAKGEPLLSTWEEEDDSEGNQVAESEDEKKDDEPDALLIQASEILADALVLEKSGNLLIAEGASHND